MENAQKYESLIGTMIDGRYKVLSLRGIGGMAVVLKAEDTHMHRTVALKILSEEYSSDEDAVRRFVNESKAVALLDHEHIVAIYDVAFDGKYKYIVMEYLDGHTLKEYMLERGKLSVDEALGFTEQILSALEHAHEKGVIHRDIKPQNILLLPDGKLKVADFGIAKTPDSKSMPNNEKAMGTVHYISPEQAAGNPTGFFSDLYSVGVMLYEMVTGRLPFEASTPLSVAMMQINNQPTPPRKLDPAIPKGLEQIILKSMSKNPADRFKSARSMLRAVQIVHAKPNAVFEDRPKAVKELPAERANADSKKPKQKSGVVYKNSRRTMFPVILGVFCAFTLVAAVVVAIVAISFFNGSLAGGYQQKVPNLIGKKYNDTLVAQLNSNNYRLIAIDYIYDENCDPNTIMKQSPEAGANRRTTGSNAPIDLSITVSLGKESIAIPKLAMQDAREAQILLEDRGLTVQISEEYSDVVPEGNVIGTVPQADNYAAAGDAITLIVSRGPNVIMGTVPTLTGMSFADAKRIIAENNYELGEITREPSDLATDTVISQSPDAGSQAAKYHTKIDLTLSIQS